MTTYKAESAVSGEKLIKAPDKALRWRSLMWAVNVREGLGEHRGDGYGRKAQSVVTGVSDGRSLELRTGVRAGQK